jgi:hypothetical protein
LECVFLTQKRCIYVESIFWWCIGVCLPSMRWRWIRFNFLGDALECCVYVKNIFWRCIKTFFGDASVSAFLLCVYVEYILIFLVMRWSVAFTLKTSFGDALVCAFLLCVDVENVLIFLVMRLAWNVTRLYLNWYHMATIHDLTNVFQTIFGYFFKGTCMIYLNNYHYVANTFRPFLQVNR